MAFGTKPQYRIKQRAPRHFFQTAERSGVGRLVIESIFGELPGEALPAVDLVLSKLPKNFREHVALSVQAGVK